MTAQEPLHATAFAYNGIGCMLLGSPGTGKSRIAAEALSMGAKLIGDDRIVLEPMMGMVAATPAPQLSGVLELRGLGLIRLHDTMAKHVLHLVVELDPTVDERLPQMDKRTFLGVEIPFLRLAPAPYTSAAMLLIYLKAMQEGRVLAADWKPNAA